jgi:transposase
LGKEYVDGKKRLSGDIARQGTSGEVTSLKRETRDRKEALAGTLLENRLLKNSMIADGDDAA